MIGAIDQRMIAALQNTGLQLTPKEKYAIQLEALAITREIIEEMNQNAATSTTRNENSQSAFPDTRTANPAPETNKRGFFG